MYMDVVYFHSKLNSFHIYLYILLRISSSTSAFQVSMMSENSSNLNLDAVIWAEK